jgi:hypothetical protein
MDPIEKKTDPARPSHPDSHERTTVERSAEERINQIANKAADKGRNQQRKDESGNDEFTGIGPA